MCSLRDAANSFYSAEVRVFGLSLDSVAKQKEFHEREELNFPLLSDPDGSVAWKYGTAGPGEDYARRVSFVIDPEGVLRAIDTEVDVTRHGEELIELIESLQSE